VHDVLAHFVILPELAANTDIEGILKIRSLFLQGHVGQDILDYSVYVVGIRHDFSAGQKI